ncbi:DMT family transporter [Massilia sp. TS11]|nr:DMT family transporter [Massilia sp. TS11]MCG2585264.1 DMT family transporter [Massilia sp. TS11]
MIAGVLYAMGAGMFWGLVFVAPLMLPEYPGLLLSFGRYLAYGLIALLLAVGDRRRILRLPRSAWIEALKLCVVGNLLYYALLASAIQLADAPLPTMIIGTLPVVIAIASNWSPGHPSESIAWGKLAPSLLIISAGLLLVNWSELQHIGARSLHDYALGAVLASAGVATWTWYPIRNARFLRAHPEVGPATWATVQGLATLPLALAGFLGYGLYAHLSGSGFAWPFGPAPLRFVGLMLFIGLTASWLGILLWNQASQRLPTSLVGQLIVFETLFAMAYAFCLRGTLPSLAVSAGIALLCIGVAVGTRAFRRHAGA